MAKMYYIKMIAMVYGVDWAIKAQKDEAEAVRLGLKAEKEIELVDEMVKDVLVNNRRLGIC